jgi:hypothetical protein
VSLNWGGNVVQMRPRRTAETDWAEYAELFPVPRITEVRHASEDKDFADFYKREKSNGPRMLSNALVIAFCVALGVAVCVWRFR